MCDNKPVKNFVSREDEVLAKYMGWYKEPITNNPNVWKNHKGIRTIPKFTQSLDSLFTVIFYLQLEDFNVSTEVYGAVNSWSGQGDYQAFSLARKIVEIIEKYTDGVCSSRKKK